MAMKHVCDRCGAEINPVFSATYVEVRKKSQVLYSGKEYELCCSCALNLNKWLGQKDGDGNG